MVTATGYKGGMALGYWESSNVDGQVGEGEETLKGKILEFVVIKQVGA